MLLTLTVEKYSTKKVVMVKSNKMKKETWQKLIIEWLQILNINACADSLNSIIFIIGFPIL